MSEEILEQTVPKKRMLSGIKPSGDLTLGSYLGAVKNWAERADEYAGQIAAKLDAAGFRAETDLRNEKIGKKIREATLDKTPYMLVLGDRDIENQTVSVRHRSGEDLGAMTYAEFEALLAEEVNTKIIK